jgi:hypothetical protein
MTVACKLNIFMLDDGQIGQTFSVLSRDISLTGLGLLQSVALQSGTKVIIELPRSMKPLFMVSTIMHTRPLADGLLAVGLEFLEAADENTAEYLRNNDVRQHSRIRDSVLQ